MLSQAQIEFFHANGYVNGGKVLSDEEVEVLRSEIMRTIDPEDTQFYIVDSDVLWEGPSLICDHCCREIKSVYGDPDASSDNA